MKVPNYIKNKMHKVAQIHARAIEEMNQVEDWLENHGFDTSDLSLRDGGGCSLEELEYGNDITDELCERIELEHDRRQQDD